MRERERERKGRKEKKERGRQTHTHTHTHTHTQETNCVLPLLAKFLVRTSMGLEPSLGLQGGLYASSRVSALIK